MKKELPKLFYIQENENTNEYCERLGLSNEGCETAKEYYGDYSVFENNIKIDAYYNRNLDSLKQIYPKAIFIDLAEYLPSDKPKWQPLTRGGYPCNVIREDRGDGMMSVEYFKNGVCCFSLTYKNGKYYNDDKETEYDLLPYQDEKEEIKKEIEELESRIKELKGRL